MFKQDKERYVDNLLNAFMEELNLDVIVNCCYEDPNLYSVHIPSYANDLSFRSPADISSGYTLLKTWFSFTNISYELKQYDLVCDKLFFNLKGNRFKTFTEKTKIFLEFIQMCIRNNWIIGPISYSEEEIRVSLNLTFEGAGKCISMLFPDIKFKDSYIHLYKENYGKFIRNFSNSLSLAALKGYTLPTTREIDGETWF